MGAVGTQWVGGLTIADGLTKLSPHASHPHRLLSAAFDVS